MRWAHLIRLFPLALVGLVLTGCAWRKDDRCYLSMDRYRDVRTVYLETGSMQRVEQVMEDERWSTCERNQLRYLLRKDLFLDDAPGATAR
ncbi:MAG: hypothetical protein KF858_04665 [Candidatus Sumerlaeia bacterium]|nr:hypothetical protein [Candidatus Sumerlaeia bacterium]